MLGSRGIWHDGWKAITTHPTLSGWSNFNDDEWELYHVDEDRSEMHNLAAEHPEKVRELVPLVLGGRRESGVPARRPRRAEIISRLAGADAAAQPVHLLPGHGRGSRVASGERA